jgi:hypothetical protein
VIPDLEENPGAGDPARISGVDKRPAADPSWKYQRSFRWVNLVNERSYGMSERRLRTVAVLLIAWAVLCAPPAAAQNNEQEQEKSGLEDFLKGVVEDVVEDQLGGQLGRIRSLDVLAEEASWVVLRTTFEGVGDPTRVRLAAELYDQKMQVVDDVEVEHDPVPEGNGSIKVRVAYTGSGTLYSSALKLSLVDSEGGRPSSHRRIKLVHNWTGTGGAAGTAAPDEGSGELTVRADEEGDEQPAKTVDLEPARVGDTPAKATATAPAASGTAAVAKPSTGQRKPARTAPKQTTAPQLSTARIATGMVMVSSLDLYSLAPKATWASTAGPLTFGGATNDNRGFARGLNQAVMMDGATYQKVLQTHPPWVSGGTITGKFQVHLPASASRFSAKIGFLRGANSSDGVNAKVSLKGAKGIKDLAVRRLQPNQGVVSFTADIPADWRGQDVTVLLIVQAGQTSAQDWFTWIAPTIQ